MNYAALKSELENDPASLGYAAYWAAGTDWKLAELLNAVNQTIDIDRTLIPAHEIISATTAADFAALSTAEKQRYQIITGAGEVDASNANVRGAFAAMFPSGTTRNNLNALLTRKGSRAEFLFGQNVAVLDVSIARSV